MQQSYNRDIWKKDGIFAVACLSCLICLLMFSGLRVAGALGFYQLFPEWAAEIIFSTLSQVVMMMGIPVVVLWIYKRRLHKRGLLEKPTALNHAQDFGLRKMDIKTILIVIGLGVLCFFFNSFVSGVANGVLVLFGFRFPTMVASEGLTVVMGNWAFLLMLVLIAVFPGFCEEVSYRGMLMNGFVKKLGLHGALLVSSFMFGLMHLNVVQVIFATVLGYLMGMAVLATRNLWAGIIVHFINNALAVYMAFAPGAGWMFGDVLVWLVNLNFIVYLLVMLGVYFAIREILMALCRRGYMRERMAIAATVTNAHPAIAEYGGAQLTLEQVADRLDHMAKQIPMRWARMRFYCDPQDSIELSLRRGHKLAHRNTHVSATMQAYAPNISRWGVWDRVLLGGILFFGSVVTIMTLIWGFM